MTEPPSRPEARRRFGLESANELGAPVASSIPEQLPGREPASARKGSERVMMVHGFSVDILADMVRAKLAAAKIERVMAGGRPTEVVGVRITDAGSRTLSKRAK